MSDDLASFDAVAYINEPRWHAMSLGLDRIKELLKRLGDPQDSLRFVHVAGTNGKGSTSAMMASVLCAAGYKTGLFTSPYIERFEERIRVDGHLISSEDLRQVTWQVHEQAEAMTEHPTEFELMTAVAFTYFAQQHCDIVVAEVGMGGRLDSTNVIKTVEVSLIAPIALDHCKFLGNTLPEIAAEKAGIIKPGVPVISAVQDESVYPVLEEVAAQHQAPFVMVHAQDVQGTSSDFSYKSIHHIKLALTGSYQRFNAALALEGCFALRARGWNIPNRALIQGLSEVRWPGRFEIVAHNPEIIIDGAHNPHAAHQLAAELSQRYPLRYIIFVMGVMEDKDHRRMLADLLPLAKALYCYTCPVPRAMDARSLASEALQVLAEIDLPEHSMGCMVQACGAAAEAVDAALRYAGEHDVVCLCGSLYGIGPVKDALRQHGIACEHL